MARGEPAPLSVRRNREHFANGVEGFEIRRGIRAGCAPDGRLIDDDDFPDIRITFEAVAEFFDAAACAFGGERAIKNIVNERGLSGAAYSRHYSESAERNHQVNILQIVERRAVEPEKLARGLVANVWHGDRE